MFENELPQFVVERTGHDVLDDDALTAADRLPACSAPPDAERAEFGDEPGAELRRNDYSKPQRIHFQEEQARESRGILSLHKLDNPVEDLLERPACSDHLENEILGGEQLFRSSQRRSLRMMLHPWDEYPV